MGGGAFGLSEDQGSAREKTSAPGYHTGMWPNVQAPAPSVMGGYVCHHNPPGLCAHGARRSCGGLSILRLFLSSLGPLAISSPCEPLIISHNTACAGSLLDVSEQQELRKPSRPVPSARASGSRGTSLPMHEHIMPSALTCTSVSMVEGCIPNPYDNTMCSAFITTWSLATSHAIGNGDVERVPVIGRSRMTTATLQQKQLLGHI